MTIDFLTLLERLADTGLKFMIVGVVAARRHGSNRVTDVVPALGPDAWAKAIDTLWNAGARPRIPEPCERVRDLAQVERWIREKGMIALSLRSPDGLVEIYRGASTTFVFARSRCRSGTTPTSWHTSTT